MKIFRLYGSRTPSGFAFQGLKSVHSDGLTYNDTQTAMAVIQWLGAGSVADCWHWDGGKILRWDGGTPINL